MNDLEKWKELQLSSVGRFTNWNFLRPAVMSHGYHLDPNERWPTTTEDGRQYVCHGVLPDRRRLAPGPPRRLGGTTGRSHGDARPPRGTCAHSRTDVVLDAERVTELSSFRADGRQGLPGAGLPGAGPPAPGRGEAQGHSSGHGGTRLVLSRPLRQAREQEPAGRGRGNPSRLWGAMRAAQSLRRRGAWPTPAPRRIAHPGPAGLRWPLKARRGGTGAWGGDECLTGWRGSSRGPLGHAGYRGPGAHPLACMWPTPVADELVADESK